MGGREGGGGAAAATGAGSDGKRQAGKEEETFSVVQSVPNIVQRCPKHLVCSLSQSPCVLTC